MEDMPPRVSELNLDSKTFSSEIEGRAEILRRYVPCCLRRAFHKLVEDGFR